MKPRIRFEGWRAANLAFKPFFVYLGVFDGDDDTLFGFSAVFAYWGFAVELFNAEVVE